MSKCVVISTRLSSYGLTVRVILEEKGVAYEQETIEIADLKTTDYIDTIHPFSKTPAFFHDDLRLFETAAIARYIDEKFDGPALQPADPAGRAIMQKWISIADNYIYPAVIQELVLQRMAPNISGSAPDEALILAAIPKIDHQLLLLETTLDENKYLAGELSLADFFVATVIQYLKLVPEGSTLLDGRPLTKNWLTNILSRESFKRATLNS